MHLTIGVTGHRDLLADEIPALKEKVQDFFLQLKSDYPDLDLQLMTPLAEGSDRLVADVASEMGIKLIVPLPMPQTEYEQDFSSRDAVEAFRDSLDSARVIHLRTLPEAQGRAVTTEDRDRQYAQLGVFISNHSQILLALCPTCWPIMRMTWPTTSYVRGIVQMANQKTGCNHYRPPG